ncbi:hypothetical protein CPTT1_002 [Escherichia phage T1]|uniref:Uncharacterized protein n=3 Tax=Tunavirus T1 TaxID=1921008 RepID=A0A3S9W129_BPT1|nr:hypothetical protein ST76 [Escherichia phage T1]AAP49924.1 hypothetical protein CPTT1_002 [Escherichia phage T1]AZS32509.1 hypothetical protein [Escherichia phage T1]QEG04324.1 hypothetical protein [Tunavirus T1]
MFNIKPLTEAEKQAQAKQTENIQVIADALIGKRSIKINLDTVGQSFFTKGLDKYVINVKARDLVARIQKLNNQKLKLIKVEGNMCEIENLSAPDPNKWEITDVEFIVE